MTSNESRLRSEDFEVETDPDTDSQLLPIE
jgi:hypothetical protein